MLRKLLTTAKTAVYGTPSPPESSEEDHRNQPAVIPLAVPAIIVTDYSNTAAAKPQGLRKTKNYSNLRVLAELRKNPIAVQEDADSAEESFDSEKEAKQKTILLQTNLEIRHRYSSEIHASDEKRATDHAVVKEGIFARFRLKTSRSIAVPIPVKTYNSEEKEDIRFGLTPGCPNAF